MKQKGCRIYVYPKNTLHFSMLNFLTIPLNGSTFESRREETQWATWFTSTKQFIEKQLLSVLRKSPETFEIRGINLDKKYNAIALKVFPNKRTGWFRVLESIDDSMDRELKRRGVPGEFIAGGKRLKAYQNARKYFAVNVLRFFSDGQKNTLPKNSGSFEKLVLARTRVLQQLPIGLKIDEPVQVISDDYLSNNDPVVRI